MDLCTNIVQEAKFLCSLGMQPLRGCGILGGIRFPHVAGIASLDVNARLQKV